MKIGRTRAALISDITIDQDIDMDSHKLTSLAEGTANGHSLRREQLIGLYLLLAGGTMAGDLSIGAHKLKTTTHYIDEEGVGGLAIRRISDDAIRSLYANYAYLSSGVDFDADAAWVAAKNAVANYFTLRARQGAAMTEVARIQGHATNAYLQATLPMVLAPTARPGTPVVGHLVINQSSEEVEHYDGVAFQQRLHTICRTVTFESASPLTLFTTSPGTLIVDVAFEVTEGFDGTTPAIDIGDEDDPNGFVPSDASMPITYAIWNHPVVAKYGAYLLSAGQKANKLYDAAKAITATHTHAGATQGSLDIYIIYMNLAK